MSGYNGYSKSNNAVEAMKTKKLTAKQILKNKAANDKWWLEYDKKQLAGIDGDKLLSELTERIERDMKHEWYRDLYRNYKKLSVKDITNERE